VRRVPRPVLPLLVLFLASLPVVTPRIYASDEVQYFAYLRSLWFDRDLSFENEYRYFYDAGIAASPGFHETFLERTTETGRRINFGTIGSALLWAPFYAVGDLAARALNAAGREVAVDGFSEPYIAAVAYGSATYGFLAVLLSLYAVRHVVGGGWPAVLAIWIGTPLLFYMYVAPPMSHAPSAFAVALFVVTWLLVRPRWSLAGCIGLGAAAALMAMVREQDLFFVVGPALDFTWTLIRRMRGHETSEPAPSVLLRNGLAGGVAFAIGFLPQALAYLALNGRIGPSQLVTRKMSWHAPHAFDVLVSPAHGFLFWTPLAALAVGGLIALAAGGSRVIGAHPEARRLAICALVMVGFQVYVAGSVESWTVAGAFGQRRFVALSILLAIGLATALRIVHGGWPRVALGTAIGLAIWWNVGLMAQFGSGLMDRQRLELGRNAHTTFVVLPRLMPHLATRYVTDRESFYERRQ
jgi:hypothetical protein